MNHEEQIDLIHYFKLLWKRRYLIIAGTLACMVAAFFVSLSMPKIYETSLHLIIGRVGEKSIDDPYRVSEIINSVAYLDEVRGKVMLRQTASEMKNAKVVEARTVEGGRKSGVAVPLLVEIITRAHSPVKAVDLAEATAEILIQEHKRVFDELMKEHLYYQSELEGQIQAIKKDVRELDQSIKNQRTNPQVSAPAIILMQAQLEQKQSQLLQFMKELRDVKLSNSSRAYSENTRIVLPPVIPQKNVRPKIALNVLVAGLSGLIITVLVAFFIEYLDRIKNNSRMKGAN